MRCKKRYRAAAGVGVQAQILGLMSTCQPTNQPTNQSNLTLPNPAYQKCSLAHLWADLSDLLI